MFPRIPGRLNDRRTPLGELNWIFTAITDTIAWNVLPRGEAGGGWRPSAGQGSGGCRGGRGLGPLERERGGLGEALGVLGRPGARARVSVLAAACVPEPELLLQEVCVCLLPVGLGYLFVLWM